MEGENMFRKLLLVSAPALALVAAASVADDWRRSSRLSAVLESEQEVPAVSSPARGLFRARIDDDAQTIAFELSYANLEAAPAVAHIHIGQRHTNGNVVLFLCGGPAPQACPPAPAKITGLLTPADVVASAGAVGQGIDAANDDAAGFNEIIALLRSGAAYANVHTTKFLGGEIRGQISDRRR
jgi:CHRD domain